MFLQNAYIGENKWWQYLITLILVIGGALIGQLPLLFVLMLAAAKQGLSQEEIQEMTVNMDFSAIGLDPNLSLFLILLTFVFALVALWLCVTVIHKKPFRILITPYQKINWRKILFSFAMWMGLIVATEIIFFLLDPNNYTFRFELSQFLVLLFITVFVFPLQTSFEELVFRGYLMQGIGLLSRWRWIPFVFTSVAFGAMHIMNPEVSAFGTGITMVYYIGTGLFLGFVTLMDDSLELALGIHAATNIYGALFVTFDESAIQTAALFHTATVNMQWMLGAFVVTVVVFTFIVSKKYKWQDWSRWYGRIEKPQEQHI